MRPCTTNRCPPLEERLRLTPSDMDPRTSPEERGIAKPRSRDLPSVASPEFMPDEPDLRPSGCRSSTRAYRSAIELDDLEPARRRAWLAGDLPARCVPPRTSQCRFDS